MALGHTTKGYIPKDLAAMLFEDGGHLVTGIRNNMKNVLMTLRGKILLRKRSIIETMNDQLKNICDAEHSGHKSFGNFIIHPVSELIAYSLQEKKPKNELPRCKHPRYPPKCRGQIPSTKFQKAIGVV